MSPQDNRAILERTLKAIYRGDLEAGVDAMADDTVVEWPQSGERIVGRQACLTVYKNYPGGSPEYRLQRISGGPDVFTVEAVADYGGQEVYVTSIIEFGNGKIVKQTDYFANAFEAPKWRAQWVQPMDRA